MKKILFTIIVGLISNTIFAQLTVKNSNFIYAENVVVFVEDDIKINAATDYFYLRNDAQLIQGTGITGNSGVGQLSVYQTGTVNNYAYNYWGSPVGNIDIDDVTNRPFRAGPKAGIDGVMYYNISFIDQITSLPANYYVGGANDYNGTPDLTISDYWLWSYNSGTAYSEWDYLGSDGELNAGYGYTMKGVIGGNQTYDFRGKPNTGTIKVNVEKNEFTLVGNPYPSALDALDFIHDISNTSFDGTLYFWEQDATVNSHDITDFKGGYATYTISSDGATETFTKATFDTYDSDGNFTGTGATSATGKKVFRYIPISQGFMIMGDNSLVATGTVSFKNSHRNFAKEGGTTSEFFRTQNTSEITNHTNTSESTAVSPEVFNEIEYTADGFSIVPDDYKRFRINIDFNDTYTRQLVHTFHDSATEGYDRGLESKSASSLANDAYWVVEDVPHVTQALQMDVALKIPLEVKIETPRTIRFRAIDIQNFDGIEGIYLHDTDTDFYYDLTTENYEVFLEGGIYTDRFEVTFVQDSVLGIGESLINQIQLFQNNELSQIEVLNPNALDIKTLKLYDVNGRLILNNNNLGLKTKYTFNTSSLSSGVYIANIEFAKSSSLFTKKILINNN